MMKYLNLIRIAIQVRILYKQIQPDTPVKGTLYYTAETLNTKWRNSATGGTDARSFLNRWKYEKYV